jgi:two-component system response regulator RegA
MLENARTAIDYLLVDDDDDFRNRLLRALTDRHFTSTGAATISAARTLLEQQTVRRVILDLRLTIGNGLELMEYLAGNPSQSPDVVVLTGYGSIATATRAIKLGAKNYVTKPATLEEILRAFEDQTQPLPRLSVPSLPEVEWEHIQRVLETCDGNISKAAKLLGLHRRSLQRKLQKLPNS